MTIYILCAIGGAMFGATLGVILMALLSMSASHDDTAEIGRLQADNARLRGETA